ncbi:MAG: hypothetical protein IPP47_27700 [Bryobacterales bacterium]|nr:hypothetical protein [Bryobacterales bacterium]
MIQARHNVEAGIVETSDFDEQRRGWTAELQRTFLTAYGVPRLDHRKLDLCLSLDELL